MSQNGTWDRGLWLTGRPYQKVVYIARVLGMQTVELCWNRCGRMRIFYRACRVSFKTKPPKAAGWFERAMLVPAHIGSQRSQSHSRLQSFCTVAFTSDLWTLPAGPDGGGWGQRAALHAGGELPHGKWHRQELGRHEAPVGLHLWPREAQHRLAQLQDSADGAAHEPHQEPWKNHWGMLFLSGVGLYLCKPG